MKQITADKHRQEVEQKMRTFDPNSKDSTIPQWATYAPGRRPEFKTHPARPQALNAVRLCTYRGNAILYKLNRSNGQWEEVSRIENFNEIDTCQACGADLRQPSGYSSPDYIRGYEAWAGLPVLRLVRVCQSCAFSGFRSLPVDKRIATL